METVFEIHSAMTKRLMMLHADRSSMHAIARRVFFLSGDVVDSRLPANLRAAALAAEKAECASVAKRGRDDLQDEGHRRPYGGGGRSQARKGGNRKVSEGNFFCVACNKELPKSDTTHREKV